MMAATLSAQLRVEVEAPASVSLDEPYFQVRYKIASASVRNIESPDWSHFDLLSGPNQSTSRAVSFIGGKQTSQESTTITYTLAPQKAGTFTVAPLTLTVGGKTYRSSSLTLRVTGKGTRSASSSSRSEESAAAPQLRAAGTAVSENDLYIRAALSHREVYEQEAVPLSYVFYERPGVGLNSVGLSQKPDFKGVVSQEIPMKNISSDVVTVGGRTYRSGVVGRYLLFPQQSGTLTIPRQTFDCVVMQQMSGIDAMDLFFNGGGNIGKTVQRSADAVTLVVKPLPQPRPVSFSGGVGRFTVKGELLTADVRTGEMATYRVTVGGSGNLKMLTTPSLTFPSDFDTYSPRVTDHTTVKETGVTGEMVFDYTFVPSNIGDYQIPEWQFVYFDPARATYETVKIPACSFVVKQGNHSAADLEKQRQLYHSDIRPLDTHTDELRPSDDYYVWLHPTSWLLYLPALLGCFGLYAYLRRYLARRGDVGRRRQRKAGKVATRRLKAARASLDRGDVAAFYAALDKALSDFLTDKLGPTEGVAPAASWSEALSARGVSADTIEALRLLKEDCAYARFAPADADRQPEEDYERAAAMIDAVNKQLP